MRSEGMSGSSLGVSAAMWEISQAGVESQGQECMTYRIKLRC